YPPSFNVGRFSAQHNISRNRHIFVIRNARIDPEWADTKRYVMNIAGRAISSLIENEGTGDLYRIYATAKRDKIDFTLAYIPSSFSVPLNDPFEQRYMQELFKDG